MSQDFLFSETFLVFSFLGLHNTLFFLAPASKRLGVLLVNFESSTKARSLSLLHFELLHEGLVVVVAVFLNISDAVRAHVFVVFVGVKRACPVACHRLALNAEHCAGKFAWAGLLLGFDIFNLI